MSEIKAYALTVPSDEVYMYWMGNKKIEEVLHEIDLLGINPDGAAHHLLFRTSEARKEAYNRIHEAFPESLCAYNPVVARVDTKYLKQQS